MPTWRSWKMGCKRQKWRPYKAKRLVSMCKSFYAKKDRNGPSSANQGLSTCKPRHAILFAPFGAPTHHEAKLAPPSNFIQVWCYSECWDSVLQRGNAWGMFYHYPWLAISICGPAATIDVNQLFISYEVEQNVLWRCKRSWGFTTMVGPGRQEHV